VLLLFFQQSCKQKCHCHKLNTNSGALTYGAAAWIAAMGIEKPGFIWHFKKYACSDLVFSVIAIYFLQQLL